MAWQTPKQNWTAADGVTMDDMNRIEGNNQANKDNIASLQQNFDAHKSETASTTAKGHVQLYNGTDSTSTTLAATANAVKTAMDKANSAFQSANDGKTNLAAVIGSPAAAGNTFTQLKDYIQTDKNILATNLTNKGQSSAETETLAALVAKVANVNTGKKFASGEGTYGISESSIQISGLAFNPSLVVYNFTGDLNYGSSHFCIKIGFIFSTPSFYKYVDHSGADPVLGKYLEVFLSSSDSNFYTAPDLDNANPWFIIGDKRYSPQADGTVAVSDYTGTSSISGNSFMVDVGNGWSSNQRLQWWAYE